MTATPQAALLTPEQLAAGMHELFAHPKQETWEDTIQRVYSAIVKIQAATPVNCDDLTNDQIIAGAAVIGDNRKPVGRNTAISVWEAMRTNVSHDPNSQINSAEIIEAAIIRVRQGHTTASGRISPSTAWAISLLEGVRDEIKAATPAALLITPEERDALIDAKLQEYGYPANTRNAARSGWYACLGAIAKLQTATPAEPAQAPDGRGTDAQIECERDIARHAIVGALAAGYAGSSHPGADHWLAAAHDAGARIAALEKAEPAQSEPVGQARAALSGKGA